MATTYYTATTGDDTTGTGAIGSPWRTIAGAATHLVAGDTLLVRGAPTCAGIYDENLSTFPSGTSWSNKILVQAFPGETVWLAPASGSFAIYFFGTQKYIEFDGINIDGSHVAYAVVKIEYGGGQTPHHIRMRNLEVIGNSNGIAEGVFAPQHIICTAFAAGAIGGNEFINLTVHGGGDVGDFSYGFYIQSPDNLIENCNVYDTAGFGIQIYNGNQNSPYFGPSPDNNIVRNCFVHDITRSGNTNRVGIMVTGVNNAIYNNVIYRIGLGADGAGLYVYTGSGNKLYNNTVYGGTAEGIVIESTAGSANEVKNNISYNNAGGNFRDSASGTLTATNNTGGTNPNFFNASGGDFHLTASSTLAIDHGTTLAIVTTDIEGTPRPQPAGGVYDIGAYEYGITRTAALTGTGASGMTEADVVSGSRTFVITLTGDTFIA